jgi:hypothetical protein
MAVGWYLRFSLSYRDVEELVRERGMSADHVTVWRWVQRYAPAAVALFLRLDSEPGLFNRAVAMVVISLRCKLWPPFLPVTMLSLAFARIDVPTSERVFR